MLLTIALQMNRPIEDLESQPVDQKTPLSLSLLSRILSILHSDVSVAYRETDEVICLLCNSSSFMSISFSSASS